MATNPFDQFDSSAQQQAPMVVGTKRPEKPNIRQMGNQLGVVDDQGHFTPTYTAPPSATNGQPKQIPANAASGIQANIENLRAIDAAIAALKSRPQSIGPGTGALGDTFTQFNDPQGTDVRAKVGNIGAVKIHDLSGAAVSPTEAPRFSSFVPTVHDRPEVAEQKLKAFREQLKAQVNEQLHYYGPENGYLPYNSPLAEQFLKEQQQGVQVAPATHDAGFGLKENPNSLSEDQQAKEKAFLATNPNPEQYAAFLAALQGGGTIDPDAAKARLDALKGGAAYNPAIGTDPRAQQKIDQYMQQGGGPGAAAVAGVADTASLGFADEFGAGVNALGESLSGNGSFGDNYNVDLQANRGYQDQLQQNNPGSYIGGQIVGGGLLPMGGVSGAGDLAKLAALYGGAYGVGSGTDAGSRVLGGVEGAAAGGATGYGLGKLSNLIRPQQSAVPQLVDQTTGALNQPLEAMRPGGRVQAASQFGIDLPMDAAGGRTAALVGKGLDIMPGSAGVMEDVRRGTEQQVANAADRVAGQFGSSRTLNEAGAELQRGAMERNDRAAGVISKAYNAIPISDAAVTSKANTVGLLQQLTGRFQSNPKLAEAMHDPKLAQYLDAFQNGDVSWSDMKDFRSLIGEKIGQMRFGESSSVSDLRALYGALSQDMKDTATAQGPGALRAFERANNLNRQNEQLVQGALTRILGKDGQLAPEKAAAAVQAMTKGGKSTGDIRTLAQIKGATVKSGAWDEIAATMIRLGGQPANSQGRDFNPQTFVQWYSDMSEPARSLLFKPELRKSLDQFVAVNQRLMKVNALRNTSNTTPNMIGAGLVGGAGMAAAMGHMTTLLAIGAEGAANFAMAKVWTNPGFVKWATGFAKATNPNAAKSQIGRLGKLAAANPELREPLVALQQKLLSAVNDNFTPSIAASSPDQAQQNQQ